MSHNHILSPLRPKGGDVLFDTLMAGNSKIIVLRGGTMHGGFSAHLVCDRSVKNYFLLVHSHSFCLLTTVTCLRHSMGVCASFGSIELKGGFCYNRSLDDQ